MSKLTLLELTEKEIALLQNAVIKEKQSWEDKDPAEAGSVSIENNVNTCNGVWAKLDESSKSKPDVLVTAKDLFYIKSLAIDEYKRLPTNARISEKEVEHKDLVHISLANAVFSWLNGKGLLKRVVKFEYTDDSSSYEGNEY